jgi:hypothetical protein
MVLIIESDARKPSYFLAVKHIKSFCSQDCWVLDWIRQESFQSRCRTMNHLFRNVRNRRLLSNSNWRRYCLIILFFQSWNSSFVHHHIYDIFSTTDFQYVHEAYKKLTWPGLGKPKICNK